MKYDEIFEKPITEYSDEEIRARAMELREKCKLVGKRKSASQKATTNSAHKPKKSPAEQMLESAIAQAAAKKKESGE